MSGGKPLNTDLVSGSKSIKTELLSGKKEFNTGTYYKEYLSKIDLERRIVEL
jgi:hypothetical protein